MENENEVTISTHNGSQVARQHNLRNPKVIVKEDHIDPNGHFEVFTDPCAILSDPESGRTMAVTTDCPGVQFYSGNFLEGETGKDGVSYGKRSGICLETQYYPDAVNHPEWPQPFTKAGERYHSETVYRFS